jgi:ABC-type branched-subunit amino acid transport system substrate-binding protein
MNIKHIVGLIIIIALVIVGYLFISGNNKNATESIEPIRIGFVGPLTGPLAFIGKGIQDAMLLANTKLTDTKYKYELIFEDDQLDPKKTVGAANKLINIDRVDVVVSVTSGSGNIVSPIAQQQKVVHFGIGASDANVAKGNYNFIHWTPPSKEVEIFVQELQKRAIKKIGIFVVNQEGGIATVNSLKDSLEDVDISIITEQNFNFGETDFRSIITKAKKDGEAEIYFLWAFSPELEILTRQLRELGIKTAITSIETFETSQELSLFENQWYVNVADPTDEFRDNFKTFTGNNPSLGAANGFDIVNIVAFVVDKIKSKQKPSTDLIANELTKINNFKSAVGNISMNEEGILISEAVVRIIKDGQPVTIY